MTESIPLRADVEELGFEHSQERVAALVERDEVGRLFDMGWQLLAPGEVEVVLRPTAEMMNGHGILHGGFAFILADTCFAYVCESVGAPSVTRQAEITYIAPGSAETVLHAHGCIRTRYGRNIIVDVAIRDQNGRHIAEMRGFGVLSARRE